MNVMQIICYFLQLSRQQIFYVYMASLSYLFFIIKRNPVLSIYACARSMNVSAARCQVMVPGNQSRNFDCRILLGFLLFRLKLLFSLMRSIVYGFGIRGATVLTQSPNRNLGTYSVTNRFVMHIENWNKVAYLNRLSKFIIHIH